MVEGNSKTIEQLMNSDPLSLTAQDLEQAVAYFRKQRQEFLVEEAKPKGKKAQAAPADLSLNDLMS